MIGQWVFCRPQTFELQNHIRLRVCRTKCRACGLSDCYQIEIFCWRLWWRIEPLPFRLFCEWPPNHIGIRNFHFTCISHLHHPNIKTSNEQQNLLCRLLEVSCHHQQLKWVDTHPNDAQAPSIFYILGILYLRHHVICSSNEDVGILCCKIEENTNMAVNHQRTEWFSGSHWFCFEDNWKTKMGNVELQPTIGI